MSGHNRLFVLAALTAAMVAGGAAETSAQARAVRRPVHVPARHVVVVSPYVAPFGYPYYAPFGYYDPWFGFDYQWGGIYGPYGRYGPYRYYGVEPGASVKLEVKPREAEVYVDGYYAGVVDDFDGTFQRLRVEPGEHEIALYLDGYRAVHEKVYLTHDHTFKIKQDLERLASGEQGEPRPEPPNPPQARPGYQAGQPPMPRGRRAPQAPPSSQPPAPGARQADYGTLSVRVQPADADIIVDGEKWRGPEGQERLLIDLPEGRHTVEIQKPGYRTYVTDIDVRHGETTPLNVTLRSQEH